MLVTSGTDDSFLAFDFSVTKVGRSGHPLVESWGILQ